MLEIQDLYKIKIDNKEYGQFQRVRNFIEYGSLYNISNKEDNIYFSISYEEDSYNLGNLPSTMENRTSITINILTYLNCNLSENSIENILDEIVYNRINFANQCLKTYKQDSVVYNIQSQILQNFLEEKNIEKLKLVLAFNLFYMKSIEIQEEIMKYPNKKIDIEKLFNKFNIDENSKLGNQLKNDILNKSFIIERIDPELIQDPKIDLNLSR